MSDRRNPVEVYNAARAAAGGRVSETIVREIVDATIAALRDLDTANFLKRWNEELPAIPQLKLTKEDDLLKCRIGFNIHITV